MKLIYSILMIWFLVIQSTALEAISAIPMQDQSHCQKAIEIIKYGSWINIDYKCVDAGQITATYSIAQ